MNTVHLNYRLSGLRVNWTTKKSKVRYALLGGENITLSDEHKSRVVLWVRPLAPLYCLVYKARFMGLCSEPSLLPYIRLRGTPSFSTARASLWITPF